MTEQGGVVADGTGTVLLEGPLGAMVLASGEQTAGRAAFVVHTLAPRALGSPVHTHHQEDEWSFILDGEVGVQLGDEDHVARPGDLVLKPRGVPHAFWNAGDEPARLLEVITPAGFEGYFERLGEILAAEGPPDLDALAETAQSYGLDMDPGSIDRLARVPLSGRPFRAENGAAAAR